MVDMNPGDILKYNYKGNPPLYFLILTSTTYKRLGGLELEEDINRLNIHLKEFQEYWSKCSIKEAQKIKLELL